MTQNTNLQAQDNNTKTKKQPTILHYINKQQNTTTSTSNNINTTYNHHQNHNKNTNTKDKYITYATWNCRRGILTADNQPTEKLIEVEDYMKSNKIDVLVMNEADLHGDKSRIMRSNPVNENVIKYNLNIEDYNLWMPNQWEKYEQARTIIYTRNHLIVNKVKIEN